MWTSDAALDGYWPRWALLASSMSFWYSKKGERTIIRAATSGCRQHHARKMTGLSHAADKDDAALPHPSILASWSLHHCAERP